jgi:hypothetical protein
MSDITGPPLVERRRYPRRWRRGMHAMLGLVALILLSVGGYVAFWRIGPPQLARVTPTPVHVGEILTLDGQGFDPSLEGNIVYFGDYSGRVLRADRTLLQVEVPDIGVAEGTQAPVLVKVEVDESKVSNALELVVLPALHPEPGTGPLTEDEEEEPPLASPNPGYASPRPSPSRRP